MENKSAGSRCGQNFRSPTIASIDGQQVHNDILCEVARAESGMQFFQNWISRECVPMTYSMKRANDYAWLLCE